MKLSTKSRYAVMAMVDIALNARQKPMSLSQISIRQNISLNYLEQIFVNLRKSGIVKSIKGPGGGYVLSRDSANIAISEIITSAGNLKLTKCSGEEGCTKKNHRCVAHNIWVGLEKSILNYLSSVSLLDVTKDISKDIPDKVGV